jgi:hypothetical protein
LYEQGVFDGDENGGNGEPTSPTTVSIVMFDATRGAVIANRTLTTNPAPPKNAIDSGHDINHNHDNSNRGKITDLGGEVRVRISGIYST